MQLIKRVDLHTRSNDLIIWMLFGSNSSVEVAAYQRWASTQVQIIICQKDVVESLWFSVTWRALCLETHTEKDPFTQCLSVIFVQEYISMCHLSPLCYHSLAIYLIPDIYFTQATHMFCDYIPS